MADDSWWPDDSEGMCTPDDGVSSQPPADEGGTSELPEEWEPEPEEEEGFGIRAEPEPEPDGGMCTPEEGGMSMPEEGGMSMPEEGGMSVPPEDWEPPADEGGMCTPEEGGMSMPEEGGMSVPPEESESPADEGGMCTPEDGGMSVPPEDSETPADEGGVCTPEDGGMSMPEEGGVCAPPEDWGVPLENGGVCWPEDGGMSMPDDGWDDGVCTDDPGDVGDPVAPCPCAQANIAVFAADANGNPVEGVAVQVEQTGAAGVTDVDGIYDFGEVEPAFYTVSGQKGGSFDSQSQNAPAQTSTEYSLTILLAHIWAHVEDTNGNTLVGIDVGVPELGLSGLTDQDGNFDFGDVDPGMYTVEAALLSAYDSQMLDAPGGADVTYRLTLALAQVQAYVTDGQANPLEGIQVQVVELGLSGTTGSDGLYDFGRVPPGAYTVRALQGSYSDSVTLDAAVGDVTTYQLTLAVAQIWAHVEDANGNPLAGVEVYVSELGLSGITNAEGSFDFGEVAAGVYTVEAYHQVATESQTLDVPPGGVTGFRLTIPIANIRAHVEHPNGIPLAGVEVSVPDLGLFGTTDMAGNYDFGEVAAGMYTVEASHPVATESQTLEAIAGAETEYRLIIPIASISAHVEDQLGNPLFGVEVRVSDLGLTGFTDAGGNYVFGEVAAGLYTVEATLGITSDSQTMEAPMGVMTEYRLTIQLAHLMVHVEDCDGNPIDAAAVTLNGTLPMGNTNPQGDLDLGLHPEDSYTVLAKKPNFVDATQVLIAAAGAVTQFQLVMEPTAPSSVDLDVQKAVLTLKHDRDCKLEIVVKPTCMIIEEHRIEIKRASGGAWLKLSDKAVENPWQFKIAGKFKLRGVVKIRGAEHVTPEKDVEVQFPSYAQIVSDGVVSGAAATEWQATLNDCTQAPVNQRRERGFWVRLNTTTNNYVIVRVAHGSWRAPGSGASIGVPNPTDSPANPSPTDAGAEYYVSFFHTHTPTAFRAAAIAPGATRGIGPSGADNNVLSGMDVPGIVYDYVESPAGSGSIPMGHPENSPAHLYHAARNRRTTPN